jgi:hypothetical protein
VVQAEEVQKRGVPVQDRHFVFDGGEAQLVGGSVSDAGLGAAVREPCADGVAVAASFLQVLIHWVTERSAGGLSRRSG